MMMLALLGVFGLRGEVYTAAPEVVLYASDASVRQGNWSVNETSSGAGGLLLRSDNQGWSHTATPLASPQHYFELSFDAQAGTAYRVWLRLRGADDSKWNESVWVQFSDAVGTNGSPAYGIGSTQGLLVNLERCSGCGVSGWGWQDSAYWLSQSSVLEFSGSGTHTIRVQTREDGVDVDQIVLSPVSYLSSAPGRATDDDTTLSSGSTSASASAPASGSSGSLGAYGGSAPSLPGTIYAERFDEGGRGVAYGDATAGNSGGEARDTDVDIERSSEGGYNIGWTNPGEWLNYTVNVANAGGHTVALRVASPNGGRMHVGFNTASNAWESVSIPATGGWQRWTTVEVPVSLGAGTQQMTLVWDTGGVNLRHVAVAQGAGSPTPPPDSGDGADDGSDGGSGGGATFRMMTWNIKHGENKSGGYDPRAQAKFMADQGADVIVLQEVQTWDENQPEKYRALLEEFTGDSWRVQWAPVTDASSTEGNVLLTRLPVLSSTYHQMHATSDWDAMYVNRSVAQATVRVNGVSVHLFSTHLDYYSTSARTKQLNDLMAWAAGFDGPRIVGGDFNSWWGESWIKTMMEEYSDTWEDVTGSNQNGYTVNNAVRFDYLFRSRDYSNRITPIKCWVPVTNLSDHNPVIADFSVQ